MLGPRREIAISKRWLNWLKLIRISKRKMRESEPSCLNIGNKGRTKNKPVSLIGRAHVRGLKGHRANSA